MFSQSIIGGIELYGKYIMRDWQKVTPHDVLDIRVVIGIISIKQLN